jgi:hypothetical protein
VSTDPRAAALPAIWRRVAPFLDLLDARYLPLLAVVSPQAWTVYAWLLGDGSPGWVAALGGLGYETVYVGAVAWAERGAGWSAARMPAVTALLFSVAVAVAYYGPRVGALAVLHAGFPLVAYAYTCMMHRPAQRGAPVAPPPVAVTQRDTPPVSSGAPLALPDTPPPSRTAQIDTLARQLGVSPSTVRRRVRDGLLTLEGGE